MATRRLAGDTTVSHRLEEQDHYHNSEIRPLPNESFSAAAQNSAPPLIKSSRSIVRRRRPDPRPSKIGAMSIVGLKNLFFRQTITPVPVRTKSNRNSSTPKSSPTVFGGPYDWTNIARQPLLRSNEPSNCFLNSQTAPDSRQTESVDSDNGDIESQSIDSKAEKASQKKGFRIDARVISDATIGLSDGLTVPFALTAGLSALGNTRVVIYGGFAELIAGAISMGLGGYLGAKSESASYQATRDETYELISTNPQSVMADIAEVFEPYSIPKHLLEDLTRHLADSPRLADFVMQFQHCAEEPAASRALTSAITIALGYFFGGLLPLIPYFLVGRNQVYEGLYISIGVMVVALFAFGYVKTCVVVGWEGGRNIRGGCYGGVQMVVVGSAAAGAAMGLVRLFNHDEGAV